MQHFVPETWERYYYDPSLNPFDLPFVLGLFVLSVFFILLLGVALLDDLFHQTSFEVAFFYLLGLAFLLHISLYLLYLFMGVPRLCGLYRIYFVVYSSAPEIARLSIRLWFLWRKNEIERHLLALWRIE